MSILFERKNRSGEQPANGRKRSEAGRGGLRGDRDRAPQQREPDWTAGGRSWQSQYERIGQLSLEHVANEEFARVRATSEEGRALVAPAPAAEPARKVTVPSGLPPYIASLYRTPLLSREQEVHLFRKMNYLKYRAERGRATLDPQHPNRAAMDRIEEWYRQAVATKNEIISANLRLVVSIAKRYATSTDTLYDLISDGNMSLVRAVEKFDFARGFRFSTYGTWAIVKNFARSIPTGQRYRSRFHTGQGEAFAAVEDRRSDPRAQETAQADRVHHVAGLLEGLSPREKEIIRYRFGLDGSGRSMTLREVGAAMGVTKERVRQLEVRAMRKLREAAAGRQSDGGADLPVEAPTRA